MVSSGIAKWTLADMSKGLNFNRNGGGGRPGLGMQSACVLWRGVGWDLLESTWDYLLERDTAVQELECQECKLVFWVVAESALSFKSKLKGPHIPATGLTYSHNGGKLWLLLMGSGDKVESLQA